MHFPERNITKLDFDKSIKEIENKIKYTFKDKSLLRQSFTRTSYCNERQGKNKPFSNEVLEFFGDSILSAAIITRLLEDKTERTSMGLSTALSEGDFSNIRSKLADKRNLSKSTAALGLQKYLIMGVGDAKDGVETEPSVMEDLFESIVGAVFIDSDRDMETVIRVVSGMLDTSVYLGAKASAHSPKNALQEYCADKKHRLPAPVYETVSAEGPEHKRTFVRSVRIGERVVATGSGKNQKEADTAAAEKALEILLSEGEKTVKMSGTEVLARLKAIASEKKLPSAEFRDRGETTRSTDYAPEFSIECRFMGASATGIGRSKQEARIAAAEALLSSIDGEKKKSVEKKTEKKSTPHSKKPASPKKEDKKSEETAPKEDKKPSHKKKGKANADLRKNKK